MTMMNSMQSSLEKEEHFGGMGGENEVRFHRVPVSWIVLALLIAVGTSYVAYFCNLQESPATRLVVTLFAFFFSGLYLVYYFIIYILLGKQCNGRDISDLMKALMKKR